MAYTWLDLPAFVLEFVLTSELMQITRNRWRFAEAESSADLVHLLNRDIDGSCTDLAASFVE